MAPRLVDCATQGTGGPDMDDGDQGGLIGEFGVVIVPPNGDGGAWLVTLGRWDADREMYLASSDGPLLDSREDAFDEARKVIDWLGQNRGSDHLVRVWRQMQEQRGAEEGLNETFLKSRNPWNL